MKVLSPTSGFPTWGSSNRRRNSQRIRLWRLVGFDCRTSTGLGETETPLSEGTHKAECASGPRGKEQWPHRRLYHTYLLMLEGVLQREGVAVAHCEDKDTVSRSSGKYSLVWALPESAISSTKEQGRLQCWLASGQTTNREGTQPHPSADKWIKVLLSSAHQSNSQLYPAPVPPISKLAQASEIASSTRGQTAEARRTTILQPVEQKPRSQKDRQDEKAEGYVLDEGIR